MQYLQKMMTFGVFSCVMVCLSVLMPTDAYSEPSKKKLEIIIGGDNFCKDDKDCAGDSFCNMTSHICITCPKPFEWVNGTECVCPAGTVANADNTDCVECTADEHCQDLKGNLYWVCNTGTNMCECLSGLHEESGQCVCDNANKTPDKDGNCICQLDQTDCPDTDFTGDNDCNCCPADRPKWNDLECKTCADIDATKPYYNPSTHTCEECLTDEHCENDAVCSADKTCVCELDKDSCSNTDFAETKCACCPTGKPKWDGTTSTCKACSEIDATKPYYNPDTKTCEECLTDEHCENDAVCSADKTCVCEMTGAECTSSDFNATQCMCCPAETPVYDAVSGTCKTCDEMHPEWAESGAGYDITTKQCWPYCGEQNVGLIMLVDRSGSTDDQCKTTRILTDGTKQTLYCEDLITEALQSLEIPEKMKTAMYLHNTSLTNALNNPLPYGHNDKVAIHNAITNYTLTDGTVTTFKQALNDITNNICPTGDKLILMMWTDGVLGSTETPLKNMKSACANTKFYYIGPSDKYDNNGYYAIKSLPETYAKHLNDYMKQEGCVPKPEDKTAE